MKKYIFTAETCHIPVVSMVTGRIIARSFTPYFDKDTLSVRYFALSTEGSGREDLFIPFDALGAINDVCVMVSVPETQYVPDKQACCRLIGEPLAAKAGTISLFSFGTIAQTDVDEDGAVISITLSDGHTVSIPRGKNDETSGNEAFASDALEHIQEIPGKTGAPQGGNAAAHNTENTRRNAPAANENVRDNTEKAPVKKNVPEPVTEKKEETKEAAAEPEEKKNETPKKAVKKKTPLKVGKMKFRFRKYVAPIVAMIIFFVLYCFMQFFIIKSKGG